MVATSKSISVRTRVGEMTGEGPRKIEYGLTEDGRIFLGGSVFTDPKEVAEMIADFETMMQFARG